MREVSTLSEAEILLGTARTPEPMTLDYAAQIAERSEDYPFSERVRAFSFLHRESARAWSEGTRSPEHAAHCRAMAARLWRAAGAGQ